MKKLLMVAIMLGLLSCLAQAQSPGDRMITSESMKGVANVRQPRAEAKSTNVAKDADVKGVGEAGNTSFTHLVDANGNTPLHAAAAAVAKGKGPTGYGSNVAVTRSQVEAFLEAGAVPVPNKEGLTPIGSAVEASIADRGRHAAACEGAVCALLKKGIPTQKDVEVAKDAKEKGAISPFTLEQIQGAIQKQLDEKNKK